MFFIIILQVIMETHVLLPTHVFYVKYVIAVFLLYILASLQA